MAVWNLISGLAIFLLAMSLLEQALRELVGNALQRWLSDVNSSYASAATGVAVTALVQSSSLVSLLVLAFAAAGTLPLFHALAMLAGSTVGTTVTGWLVTLFGFKLDLGALAIPILGAGALATVWSLPERRLYQFGQATVSLGLLLLGLGLMKSVAATLPERVPLALIAEAPWGVFLFTGAAVTALLQSSSATLLLVLTALHSGLLDLQQAALITVGSNFGTASTALLAVKGAAVKFRLALANLIYHAYASLIGLLLIPALALLAAIDPMVALVAFHTTFNLVGLLLFFVWLKPFAAWLDRRFTRTGRGSVAPYLTQSVARVPSAAVTGARRAVQELGLQVVALNARNLHVAVQADVADSHDTFEERYERIKRLEGEILQFVLLAQREKLDAANADALQRCVSAARDLVFAAKGLKDVRSDIAALRHSPLRPVQRFMATQLDHMEHAYARYAELLRHEHDPAYATEQLAWLRSEHDRVHTSAHEAIHRHSGELLESPPTLSTLLNVNRELWRSSLDLAAAVDTYSRRTQTH